MDNQQEELRVNELMEKILTEEEVLDVLGIKKQLLTKLRYEGKLTFCQLSRTKRIYFASDVLDCLVKSRITLNTSDFETQ